ncbi:ribose-phosphate pyrophosphokinase-like domain-containing protein, partial [Klebsiella michiganensis]|uniref:ribose-phosphate pyrophosphokinase-like domain-containing protein n=2 Tax=Pseudomonadota TaxID=1224 RepID=UPI0013D7F990
AFADQAGVAQALATRLGVPFEIIDLHRFPDGELLPRVSPARTVIIYCSLDRPTEKLLALMLSADAWRRSGAGRLVLVSPYLCY